MARFLGHRQTKGAATAKPNLPPPRHIPTLPANRSLIGQNLTVTELKYPPVSGHPQMSQRGREATVGGPLGLPIVNRQKPVVQRFKLPALKHSFPGAPARHSLMMDR